MNLNLDEETLKQLEEKYGLNAPERTEVIIGFDNMLNITRYGFSIVKKGFDSLWDAEFVSIMPIYFAWCQVINTYYRLSYPIFSSTRITSMGL